MKVVRDATVAETEYGTTEPVVDGNGQGGQPGRRNAWGRVLTCGVLPAVALLLALVAGYLKYVGSVDPSQDARAASMRAAADGAVALLSYQADTVEQDLSAARELMTGELQDSYTAIARDVAIAGSKEQISAEATVPAAAVVSTTSGHAVVLLFVNQKISIGEKPRTEIESRVRVTLDKVDGRWLMSQLEPV